MTHQAHNGRRSWVGVLALAAAIAVAPLPAVAGEVQLAQQGAPGIAASAKKAAESTELKSSTGASRLSQDQAGQPRTDLGSASFFKSKAGIVTLIAVGAGVGFALYSTSNDRVKSPGK